MNRIKSFFDTYIPAFFWWLIVLILICTPGKDLPKLGKWTELISLDKFIHVIIFGIMTFLFMRPLSKKNIDVQVKKQWFLKIAISVSIWGLVTEFIQRFWIEGRSFDMFDWAADSAGALLALFLCRKYFFNRKTLQSS